MSVVTLPPSTVQQQEQRVGFYVTLTSSYGGAEGGEGGRDVLRGCPLLPPAVQKEGLKEPLMGREEGLSCLFLLSAVQKEGTADGEGGAAVWCGCLFLPLAVQKEGAGDGEGGRVVIQGCLSLPPAVQKGPQGRAVLRGRAPLAALMAAPHTHNISIFWHLSLARDDFNCRPAAGRSPAGHCGRQEGR